MPADSESPAATELKVTDFIDFMMRDQPTPKRLCEVG